MSNENNRTALEIILNKEISRVVLAGKEQHFDIDGTHKGIRLDVYVKDEENTVYNVEMQTQNKYNIPRRGRHYQSVIDIKLMPAGEMNYNKLTDVYIIFICTFDLFGQNRYLYEFENRCLQDTSLALNDGSRKVYLNTRGNNEHQTRPELVEFLHYIEHTGEIQVHSSRVQQIDNRVRSVKKNVEVEVKYMRELTYRAEMREAMREELEPEVREKVEAEVREEVEAEVRTELYEKQQAERVSAVDSIVDKLGLGVSEACEVLGITVQEYKEIKARR